MHDLVIRNGTVVDGTGRERFVGVRIGPYVLSKFLVLAPLLLGMSVIMLAVLRLFDRLPQASFGTYAMLTFTLFLVALAGPVLGERVGLRRWLAILVGFCGVLIVSRPDGAAIDPAAFLSLGAAIFYALAQLMTRRLADGERASIMILAQNVVYFVATLAMGLIAGRGGFAQSSDASLQFLLRAWVMPTPFDLGLLALTGFVAAIAGWLQTQAYRIAPVNEVAPFEYSAIPWATVCGLVIWGEIPSASTWPGPRPTCRPRSPSIPTWGSSSGSGPITPTGSPRKWPSSPSCGRRRRRAC